MIKKVNGKAVFNPSDIVLEGGGKIESVTVSRAGSLNKVNVSMQGEAFFETFMKYPPLLRKPVIIDREGRLYGISNSKEFMNFDYSLDEMSQSGSKQHFFLYKILNQKADTEKKFKTEDKSRRTVLLDAGSSISFFEGLSKEGFRSLDLKVKSVNMNSPADKAV